MFKRKDLESTLRITQPSHMFPFDGNTWAYKEQQIFFQKSILLINLLFVWFISTALSHSKKLHQAPKLQPVAALRGSQRSSGFRPLFGLVI